MATPNYVKPAFLSAAALSLGFLAQPSFATIVVNNTGANPLCVATDVTLGSAAADYCAGYFGDLDKASPATELATLNAATDGPDWTFVYKVEDGKTEGSGLFGGILLTLVGVDLGAVSGNWTFAWEDTDDTTPSNLPLAVDIAAGFKAGSGAAGAGIAYFLFDDFVLTDDPYQSSGTFSLSVDKALSHESLFVRYGDDGGSPPFSIAEPGVLLLIGAGLVGFGVAARRKRT